MKISSPNEKNWAGYASSEQISIKQKKLMKNMLNTVVNYQLIEPNDHIMVAISGGKDSYTLLELLLKSKIKAPFDFKITAVHLDQAQPGYDGKPLENWLKNNNIDHLIIREDTYSVVIDKTKPNGTYCSLCSRLRRGILYKIAGSIKANKIALGHHLDDAIETLFLNMIYAGKLSSMPPKYLTDDGLFWVIRPLIEITERDIIAYAKQQNFPILPCNLCGSQEGLKRQKMKELINTLELEKSDIRHVILNALQNVSLSHLMDKRFLDNHKPVMNKKSLNIL